MDMTCVCLSQGMCSVHSSYLQENDFFLSIYLFLSPSLSLTLSELKLHISVWLYRVTTVNDGGIN